MELRLKPMLCGKADVVPEGDDWIAEPKMDGWRAVAEVSTSGVSLYCGRNGNDYSGKLPYIEDALTSFLAPGTCLDGELLGSEWGDVQGVMTRGNGPHVPTPAIPALTYVVFDITRVAGADVRDRTWQFRRDLLERLMSAAPGHVGLAVPHVRLSPVGPSTPETLANMLALGMEGIVCKRVEASYVNTRSNAWIKVKPQDSEDGTLIGFYEPTAGSKYDGNSVGGICFRLANGYEGRAAGMNDALRKEMYEHPERFIGRTVELRHHGIFDGSGALRHPQFLRFRDDVDQPQQKYGRAGHRKPATAPKVQTRKVMRNYKAMGDKKLLKVYEELQNGGEAAQRCGPENVERDKAVVEQEIAARGLSK